MPNDMSPTPVVLPPMIERLADRASRYCARAAALATAPDLTVRAAAKALDHMADLQSELARERVRQCDGLARELERTAQPLKAREDDLLRGRALMSEALLRARREQGDLFGHVCHSAAGSGGQTDGLHGTNAQVQAISACRGLLDLEALRPFIGENALRYAIAQHALATGRHDLQGVAYAVLPAGAHLPCAIA